MNPGNDDDDDHADANSGDDHARIEKSADNNTNNDKREEEVMRQRMDALQYVVDGIGKCRSRSQNRRCPYCFPGPLL